MQDTRIALLVNDLWMLKERMLKPLLTVVSSQVNGQATYLCIMALLRFQYSGGECIRFSNAGFTEQDETGFCSDLLKLHSARYPLPKERRAHELEDWIRAAKSSHVTELKSFAKSVQQDYAAIYVACSLPPRQG